MPKSVHSTLLQLVTRLHEQALEMAALRAALDVQFTRIAQMQAELDLLPHARRRRQTLRVLLAERPSNNNWDGPERRHGQPAEELRAFLRELRVAWETRSERARVGQAVGRVEPMIEDLTVMTRPDKAAPLPPPDPFVTVTARNSPASPTASRRGQALVGGLSRVRVGAGA